MCYVAGDISDHIEIVEKVWELLVPRFHRVFFVPGNHDLWTTRITTIRSKVEGKHRFVQEMRRPHKS